MAGDNLELAAVFEQLEQPLVDQLAGVVAEGFLDLLLDLAARAPFLAAEHFEHLLGYLQPGGAVRIEVARQDAIPGMADADHLAREHCAYSPDIAPAKPGAISYCQGTIGMDKVRIGNGCGFWGDNLDAPIRLAEKGQLDYLTLEYLAELTMSILALQKQRNPDAGFATDFLDVLERLCPLLQAQPQLRIITNAGGMNPPACAAKARAILDRAGLTGRGIAIVQGDDILPRLDELLGKGHRLAHMDK